VNLSKGAVIISWVLVAILAISYLMAGTSKLSGGSTVMFANWGYPAWFAIFIGVCEVVGAIVLIPPKTTRTAVLGLTLIMVGATYTLLAHHDWLQVWRPILCLVLLWLVWWLRRGHSNGSRPEFKMAQ